MIERVEMNLDILKVILEQNRMILEMNAETLKVLNNPMVMYDPTVIPAEDEIKYTSMSGK